MIASRTSSRSPPRTADMPVFSKFAALPMAFARSLTKRIASNSLITFATAAAVISPTEWPEIMGAETPSKFAAIKPVATING